MITRKKIPVRYIVSLIRRESIIVIFLAGLISATDEYYTEWWDVEFPIMPMSIPSMLGTIITLVLAFKMGQSYDRWWEARKIFGGIVNTSRSLIREVSFLRTKNLNDSEETINSRNTIIRLLLAWLYELVISLRKLTPDQLSHKYLTTEENNQLEAIDSNRPNAILFLILQKVQAAYNNGYINEYQELQLNKTIGKLTDEMGKAERIKNTVFPRLYSRMIDFATWNFVILLPLAFRDPNKWVEFPVVLLIAFIFFMLENLALDLQDPFENKPTDIPILSIIRNIEIFGLKTMGAKDIPEKVQEESFFLM